MRLRNALIGAAFLVTAFVIGGILRPHLISHEDARAIGSLFGVIAFVVLLASRALLQRKK